MASKEEPVLSNRRRPPSKQNLDGPADVILADPLGKTYRIPASVVETDGVKNVNY